MQIPHKILAELGLSPSEIKVYLSMHSGIVRVKDLMKSTSLVRPTVYYAISGLEQRGLVSRITIDDENQWRVEPASRLKSIVSKELEKMTELQSNVDDLAQHMTLTAANSEQPTVSYYEGADAVINIAMESLYCKSKNILSIAPQKNFFHDIDHDLIIRFVEERNKRKIVSRHLWEKPVDPKIMKKHYQKAVVRYLPEVMHGKFETAIFIYDDKTLYVASHKNSYGILVTSQEHANTMSALFEGLWIGSTT